MSKVISFFRAIGRKILSFLRKIGPWVREAGDWLYAIWITFTTKDDEDA